MQIVPWVVWLHTNGKLFRGRTTSIDSVTYTEEGLVAAWSSKPRGEREPNCDTLFLGRSPCFW